MAIGGLTEALNAELKKSREDYAKLSAKHASLQTRLKNAEIYALVLAEKLISAGLTVPSDLVEMLDKNEMVVITKKELDLLKISNSKLEGAVTMANNSTKRRGLERDALQQQLRDVASGALKTMLLYPQGSPESRALSAVVASAQSPVNYQQWVVQARDDAFTAIECFKARGGDSAGVGLLKLVHEALDKAAKESLEDLKPPFAEGT